MLDQNIFRQLIEVLERFYGMAGTVTENNFVEDVYYDALKNCTVDEFESGVASCIKRNPRQYNFFPSSGQLLEYAKGEARFPGENSRAELDAARTLESYESKMTPAQIEEANYRGRLQARVILYCTGIMTIEQKDQLIAEMESKPTYELEHIAEQAELGYRGKKNKSPSSVESVGDIVNRFRYFN